MRHVFNAIDPTSGNCGRQDPWEYQGEVRMTTNSMLTVLLHQIPPAIPEGAEVMIATVELPPGDPGTPPHRHSGPVFGYMLEGEIVFELEGEPERVIRAGEAFWEPGGDVIHYQAGNNLPDALESLRRGHDRGAGRADAHPGRRG